MMQLHAFFDAIAFTCNFYGKKAKKKRKFSPNPFIKKINKRKKGNNKTRVREIEIFTVKIKKFNVKSWKKRKKKRKLK